MKKVILRTLLNFIPRDLKAQLKNFKILALELGQWRSIREKNAVDTEGDPIPWYTYPAIEYLKRLDVHDKSIFEWGSGNSSSFWAKRAEEVISIEDDKNWFDIVYKNRLSNQEIYLIEERRDYIGAILSQSKRFDIIAVDGKYRYECAKNAVRKLSEGGLIILDNSDWFPKTSRLLKEHGLIQVDFNGFGPIVGYTTTTSLFLSKGFSGFFCFSQPLQPIGGLKQNGDE